jgi:uncharacterized protein YkwD
MFKNSRPLQSVTAAALTALITGLLLVLAAPSAEAKIWKPTVNSSLDPQTAMNEFENRVLIKINRVRANHGLSKVKYFQTCVDNMSEGWDSHIVSSGDLVHRDQMTVINNCNFTWAGECLIRGTGLTPKMSVSLWMHSPDHRAIIMKKRANRAGVAFRVDSDGRVVGVLNFGDNR